MGKAKVVRESTEPKVSRYITYPPSPEKLAKIEKNLVLYQPIPENLPITEVRRFKEYHKRHRPQHKTTPEEAKIEGVKDRLFTKPDDPSSPPIYVKPRRIGKGQYVPGTINVRQLRDKIIAFTETGGRIFAFNDNGRPICFSRRSNRDPNKRCQSPFIFHNGRCRRHGGKAKTGALAPNAKHLRNSESLPTFLQNAMARASKDPNLLSMRYEIQLVDTEIDQLNQELSLGLEENALKRVSQLIKVLQSNLDEGKSPNLDLLEELVYTFEHHKSRQGTVKLRAEAMERRRKLMETQHRLEKDSEYMLTHAQAMALMVNLAGTTKGGIAKVMTQIEKRYLLLEKGKIPFKITDQVKELVKPEAIAVRVDPSIREDFLADIATAMQKATSGTVEPRYARTEEYVDIINGEVVTVNGENYEDK